MHIRDQVPAKSRLPLYQQVAKLLRRKVETQQWLLGQQIPTLDELQKEYGVSRITIRASLDQLEAEGIIKRSRGSGTFVVKELSQERWFKLPENFAELLETVSNLKSEQLDIDQDDHPLQIEDKFGVTASAYRRLRRVHYHNNFPYCVVEVFLEKTIYERHRDDFDGVPVIPVLATIPDINLIAGKQVLKITVPDKEIAAYLNIGVGDPVADVCRSLTDQDGRVIYYAHVQYPAQTIYIEADLFPNKKHSLLGAKPLGKKNNMKK